MKKALWIPLALLLSISLLYLLINSMEAVSNNRTLPKKIDYNFHVRPILSDKCFICHGPDENARKANLRLDTPDGAYAELVESEGLYAIIPGNTEESEIIHRIFSEDTTVNMPPPESRLSLSEEEKEILFRWVEQGGEYKQHWSFLLAEKPEVPSVHSDWPKNEIDYFILDKIEQQGLKVNSEASSEALLKRVSFDIIGLPPTIELQDRFLKDDSPEAYEKIVDELLNDPHYGEKMAIHWLDVARYADSHGYQDDGFRTMWPWRDWVIHAFNENYPYDKFITMQLAGDLIENKSLESILATGFNRNHKITQEGGVIDEEYRVEYVTDRTNTFGKAFLGMTFECAKCHDHKYDPISNKDYFGTFAFFNQVPEKGLFGTIDASFADPPNIKITREEVKNEVPFVNLKDSSVQVMVMKDSIGIRDTYVLQRGAYDNRGEKVGFQTPEAILPFDDSYAKNRLGLSQWLINDSNPLTARVYVNRIWNEIFGRGLVSTVGDFGMQGEFPSHPELLDWLAKDFRENDWNIKYLVKKIVTSATYRQSASITEESLEMDPENIYLSRYSRTRFAAETVRDHVLASSGLLNPEIGGPSVKPYQPEGLWQAATSGRGTLQNYVQEQGDNLYRRGLYTFIKRTVPPPSMLMFDASNRDQCEVRRLNTNTPLQALIMLNDPHVLEASRVMAQNFMEQQFSIDTSLEKAFQKIICRRPADSEKALLLEYHGEVVSEFSNDKSKAELFIKVGEYPQAENLEIVELAALMQVIHTIFNMEEAITKT